MEIPSSEHLECLFVEGKMVRLGIGSRRACFRIPDTNLCVKGYRSEDEIALGKHVGYEPFKPLVPSVVREIRRHRYSKRNTSYQEGMYYAQLKKRLPPDLMAVFPETLENIYVPSRGWCLVENVISNFDGSPVRKIYEEFRRSGEVLRGRLKESFEDLRCALIRHAVRFYDPQNVVVQWLSKEDFRLRIVDFEPASRTLVPIDIMPLLIRMKVARRFHRFRRAFLP